VWQFASARVQRHSLAWRKTEHDYPVGLAISAVEVREFTSGTPGR
jgi:hypothetical protein